MRLFQLFICASIVGFTTFSGCSQERIDYYFFAGPTITNLMSFQENQLIISSLGPPKEKLKAGFGVGLELSLNVRNTVGLELQYNEYAADNLFHRLFPTESVLGYNLSVVGIAPYYRFYPVKGAFIEIGGILNRSISLDWSKHEHGPYDYRPLDHSNQRKFNAAFTIGTGLELGEGVSTFIRWSEGITPFIVTDPIYINFSGEPVRRKWRYRSFSLGLVFDFKIVSRFFSGKQ